MRQIFHMNKHGLLVLCTLISGWNLWAQKSNLFYLKAGSQLAYSSDRLASPMIYRTINYGGGFGYEKQFSKWMLSVSFSGYYGAFYNPKLGARTVTFSNENFQGEQDSFSLVVRESMLDLRLDLNMAAKLVDKGIHRFYLGGSLNNQMHYNTGFTNFGLGNYASLGLFWRYALVMGKHTLHWDASLPVLAYTNRLPWHSSISRPESGQVKAFFNANGNVYTLNTFQLFHSAVNYRYQFTPTFSLGAEWVFYWLGQKEPLPHKYFSNGLNVKTSFSF